MCDDEEDEDQIYADAHLIANAPEWLQYLLQENQRYKEALNGIAQYIEMMPSRTDVEQRTMEIAYEALKKEGESE